MGTRRNDLDRLLDRLVAGEEPEATGDLAPFLHPAQVARAAFVRSLDAETAREHLASLRIDRARNIALAPARGRRGLRVAAVSLVGAIVLTLGGGSAIAASSDALPGDALYGVKRAVERVSLAMHRDPVGRAALHLQFADIRLHEIAAMVLAGRDPGDVVEALEAELAAAEADALDAVALGRDSEALLEHVRASISKHITVLNNVLGKVPDQAKDAIQRAIDNAQKAQDNVQKGRDAVQNANKGGGGRKPSSPPGKGGNAPNR